MPRTIQSLALADVNQKFLDAESKVDTAIQRRQFKIKSPWRSLIPRGTYTLGEGLEKKVYRFHAGMGPQRGLQNWHPIQISRKASAGDPGYDSAKLNPHTVNYGFDSETYSGIAIEYMTEAINVHDIRFAWQLKQQLSAIYGYLGDFTNEVWDNYHREMYFHWVNNESNGFVLSDGQMNSRGFTYDPFMVDSDGDNTLTITGNADVSVLNWDYFRWLNRRLEIRAPQHALGDHNGRPVYGYVGDIDAIEMMIKHDADLREDWRHHKASMLIDNFGSSLMYDNYSIMHDVYEPRFSIKSYDGTTTTMKRIDPFNESDAALTGSRRDVSDDYLNAEFGVVMILLKDVCMTEVVPSGPATPGAGTVFGSEPGFNGKWSWINNKDMKENPLGWYGYWLMICEAFSKPLEAREEAVAVLYRRYTHTKGADTSIGEPDTAATRNVAVNAVADDVDTDNNTLTLTLDGYLDVEAGQAVIVTDDDGATDTGIVADSSAAPTYMFALSTAPSAFGKYTLAGTSNVVSA